MVFNARRMTKHPFSWLAVPAEDAAKRLLGSELVRTIRGRTIRVRIVETEAYDQDDEASHTFRGQTARNSAMFKSAGHLYVYFTYGMHYCANIVCGKEGFGAGVLIRAVEPLEGVEVIEKRRGVSGKNATNGPGKAAQALGLDLALNGHDLSLPPVELIRKAPVPSSRISSAKRIGISKGVHALRRFYIADNPYVSKK